MTFSLLRMRRAANIREFVPARHWAELAISLLILFALAVIAEHWLREPFASAGDWMVRNFGLSGLFAATLAIDSLPTPLSVAPLMLLAIKGQLAAWQVVACVSSASFIGGLIGYCIGRMMGMPENIDRWLRKYHPTLFDLMQRHGAMGVVIAGTLPIPLALGTWTAGAMQVRFWRVAAACLVRLPKTVFYVILIVGGLSIGERL